MLLTPVIYSALATEYSLHTSLHAQTAGYFCERSTFGPVQARQKAVAIYSINNTILMSICFRSSLSLSVVFLTD